MADAEMFEQEEVASKKKGLPTWLWVCGSGCLLFVVVLLGVGVWGFGQFKEMADPELQWPRVEETLPFDERPEELTLIFGWHIGVDMYMFEDSRGFMAILMQFSPSDGEEARDQMFDPEFSGGVMGMGGRKNLELGTVTVQGRELPAIRFDQTGADEDGATAGPQVRNGVSIMVDLTPEGDLEPLFLQYIRQGSGGQITDEEVQAFLAPFHVGTDR